MNLIDRYSYHRPFGDQQKRYEAIRCAAMHFADTVSIMTPESSERSRALDKLDEAMFLANAAIARNEKEPVPLCGHCGRPLGECTPERCAKFGGQK